MHTLLPDRTAAPVDVGDPAPDFDLFPFTGERRWLSDHRGAPVVVAFHPPQWDPMLVDQIEQYKAALASRFNEPIVETFLVRNDDLAAMRFGVDGLSGVFVVDACGTIAWRHIPGIDPNPHVATERVELSQSSDRTGADSRYKRRQLFAIGIAAALAVTLSATVKVASTLSGRLLQR